MWARLVMNAAKSGSSKTAIILDFIATLPALESEGK